MSIKIKVGSLIVKKGKILLIKEKIEKNNVPLWNIVKVLMRKIAMKLYLMLQIENAKKKYWWK